jgi:hypothetical protein
MQPVTEQVLGGVWRKGWRRFVDRARAPGRRGAAPSEVVGETASEIDPVALTIMALDRIGTARLRTVFHGLPVTVAVPDEQTAAIFRAALSEMAKQRPTDRLISVELAADMTASESVGRSR